ncbi:MAG: hypothetical protein ACI8TF_000685 [Paracoccaceae bacterium]|jgi:hypothetical protein
MNLNTLDPDLVGLWIVIGKPTTYEILPDASYHVADPEAALEIAADGATMTWGAIEYDRMLGTGPNIDGVWRNREDGDEWYFRPDGTYSLHLTGSDDIFGIWALRDDANTLWTREYRGTVQTNGAQLQFFLPASPPLSYGYTVQNGIWSLMDPQSWSVLATYQRP